MSWSYCLNLTPLVYKSINGIDFFLQNKCVRIRHVFSIEEDSINAM